MNTNNLKDLMKSQDITDSFFQNSDNFYNKMFSVNGKRALRVAFIRYTLLNTKL